MADERIPITYSYDAGTKAIHRKKGKGDEILEDKVVATYDPDTRDVTFPSLSFLRGFKLGVITFLAENEMPIREFVRADLKADQPLTKNIPPRPKKDRLQGDKTPAVAEWYHRYFPSKFAARYGVIGTYSGPVSYLEPLWEPRPVDGVMEFRGCVRMNNQVDNAMVATRAVAGIKGDRLTYIPEECIEFDEEEPEIDEEAERGAVSGRAGKGDE
jgi:hypothetical protein